MMDTFVTSIILPILGILILIFCVLSFVFPYGAKFKDKKQTINAFGVKLEVSVLTLFILIGVCLSSFGLYTQIKDYEGALYDAKGKIEKQCPTCKEGKLVLRGSIYGKFYGCSRYPKCKYIEKLVEEIHLNYFSSGMPPLLSCGDHPLWQRLVQSSPLHFLSWII